MRSTKETPTQDFPWDLGLGMSQDVPRSHLEDVQRSQLGPAPLLGAVHLRALDDHRVRRQVHTPGQRGRGHQDLQENWDQIQQEIPNPCKNWDRVQQEAPNPTRKLQIHSKTSKSTQTHGLDAAGTAKSNQKLPNPTKNVQIHSKPGMRSNRNLQIQPETSKTTQEPSNPPKKLQIQPKQGIRSNRTSKPPKTRDKIQQKTPNPTRNLQIQPETPKSNQEPSNPPKNPQIHPKPRIRSIQEAPNPARNLFLRAGNGWKCFGKGTKWECPDG